MPDSIFPMLTKNNRLDMIDFIDAHMLAEVTNLLDGTSELRSLSHDSLTVHMSEALDVTMYLIKTEAEYDSARQVVCIERIYTLASDSTQETVTDLYTLRWRRLSQLSATDQPLIHRPTPSTILKRDEELFDERRRRIE
jgi:hypothetical protein